MRTITIALLTVFLLLHQQAWGFIEGIALGIDDPGVYPDAVGDSSCPPGYVGNSHCCPSGISYENFNDTLQTTFCCAALTTVDCTIALTGCPTCVDPSLVLWYATDSPRYTCCRTGYQATSFQECTNNPSDFDPSWVKAGQCGAVAGGATASSSRTRSISSPSSTESASSAATTTAASPPTASGTAASNKIMSLYCYPLILAAAYVLLRPF